MLTRLQDTLGQEDWVKQILLLRGAKPTLATRKTIDLIVGYSGSPSSQAALDLTLWIAHQIRLVTKKQVTVHVVYVVEDLPSLDSGLVSGSFTALRSEKQRPKSGQSASVQLPRFNSEVTILRRSPLELNPTRATGCNTSCQLSSNEPPSALEKADCILWQARCVAEEWRGSLDAHLRFGTVAGELREVVESLHADLLVLGCDSANHPLIRQLTSHFPCPVVGVPTHVAVA
ncbi:MAG: universal stress protein [Leptolyngbyaceae cyanobacterium RM2_2_4]|nr:universal stress protein [Leptolyngbyaceae cyanobacterium SM1_4_3]NJN89202.1 universal stress protein [Leptolyngbyaceae cyanobacterium SL_5_14]NJO49488.1 universal stress protein [Leptolyngbyaceae cyanobacterium RM2_2_4]